MKVGSLDDFYELKVENEPIGLIIQIDNSTNSINRFLVLSIIRIETRTEVILKRLE